MLFLKVKREKTVNEAASIDFVYIMILTHLILLISETKQVEIHNFCLAPRKHM